jgi:hypothetical protein
MKRGDETMNTCAALLAIGLATACPPPPADDAGRELRAQRQERVDQERAAAEKVARLYRGLGDCPECGKVRLDPKTMTVK